MTLIIMKKQGTDLSKTTDCLKHRKPGRNIRLNPKDFNIKPIGFNVVKKIQNSNFFHQIKIRLFVTWINDWLPMNWQTNDLAFLNIRTIKQSRN